MKYVKLVIEAKNPETDIWVADDEGNLVQKEIGRMDTSLMPGNYVVHFGLKNEGMKFSLLSTLDCLTITEGQQR